LRTATDDCAEYDCDGGDAWAPAHHPMISPAPVLLGTPRPDALRGKSCPNRGNHSLNQPFSGYVLVCRFLNVSVSWKRHWRLAEWARRTNAINVNEFNPALPAGMSERVNAKSNRDGHAVSHDRNLWSMDLDFRDDIFHVSA
jgi:hypothetical protein